MSFPRSIRLVILVVLPLIAIAGCVSPYRELGILGSGYSEARLDSLTWQVTYQGDRSMKRERVERYALYRCAEIAVAAGADFFSVVETTGEMQTGTNVSTDFSARASGDRVTTTGKTKVETGRAEFSVTRIIRLHHARPEGGGMVYDARQLVQSLAAER